MHYAIVSANPPVLMPNGLPYENTEACWKYLTDAAKSARYLEYVDPAAFVDRRNEEPVVYLDSFQREAELYVPSVEVLEEMHLEFPAIPDYSLYSFISSQRYHLEVWCEKSTMNDVLIPLVSRYQAVLLYGKGELSITMALEAIRRFERTGKPVRIFYVSDFDPAGVGMPVSMARKVEYFLHKLDLEMDVKLFPIVLTAAQVSHYTRILPTPIKPTERRKAKFEERFGTGGGANVAVELDALEALYPGELERILQSEMERYYDRTLNGRVARERARWNMRLEEVRNQVYDRYRAELDALREEEKEMQRLFNEQLASRMARHSSRRYTVSQAIYDALEKEQPDITALDVPEAVYGEERGGALFDSSRDYLTQNDVYQAHKGNAPEMDTDAV
jgi:hypothetical protein